VNNEYMLWTVEEVAAVELVNEMRLHCNKGLDLFSSKSQAARSCF